MGDIPLVVRIEDYQDSGGVKMPCRSVQGVGPTEVVIQIESMEWDVTIEVDLTMPEVVRELIPQASPAE